MVFVGEYLRKARKKNKVPIDLISKKLNISINFLEAIENDDFSKTPGGAYTLGYIRLYSDFLKLDTNQIIEKYKTQISFSEFDKVTDLPKPIEAFNKFKSMGLMSLGVFTFVALGFYFMFVDKINFLPQYAITSDLNEVQIAEIEEFELKTALKEMKNNKINKEKTLNQLEEINLLVTDSLENDSPTLSNNSSSAIASFQGENSSKEINNLISIKALESTWIQLRNENNEIVYSKLMKLNDEYVFSIKDNYTITTGNAGNLIVSVGGKIMGKLGKNGEVLESLVITLDHFQN